MTVSEVFAAICTEVRRAEMKFPGWPTDYIHAAAIVQEECGELVQSCNDYENNRHHDINVLRTEAIHTAAMAMRFLLVLPKETQ